MFIFWLIVAFLAGCLCGCAALAFMIGAFQFKEPDL